MTQKVPITMACWNYDRMRALMEGRVEIEGVDLTYIPLEIPESCYRMLHFGDFDVCEMSMAWYVRSLFVNPRPFVAIPVFPSRSFRHSGIYVNVDSGIGAPADLRGKRVGCPEYQQSAGVWIRGILADRYDVALDSVTYLTGGLVQAGRKELPLGRLPPGIVVEPIPAGETLSKMLERGDLDAVYTAHVPECFAAGSPRVRRLFPDYVEAEKQYYRDTGIFPVMHTLVISSVQLARHPWLAASLLKACEQSKQLAYPALYEPAYVSAMLPWMMAEAESTRALFGEDDFWPYGIERNRETLATFLRYAHEQGIIPDAPAPEDLFPPSTLQSARK